MFRATAQPAPMKSDFASWPATGPVSRRTGRRRRRHHVVPGGADSIGLGARKLAALVYSPRPSSTRDSAVVIGDWFADEMGAAFASRRIWRRSTAMARRPTAASSGVCPGLLAVAGAGKVTAASGHDTFAELDATDLANLIAVLPAAALPGAAWFTQSYAYRMTFCRLATAPAASSPCRTATVGSGRTSWACPCMLTQVSARGRDRPLRAGDARLRRHAPRRACSARRENSRSPGPTPARRSPSTRWRSRVPSGSRSTSTTSATRRPPARSSAWSASRTMADARAPSTSSRSA